MRLSCKNIFDWRAWPNSTLENALRSLVQASVGEALYFMANPLMLFLAILMLGLQVNE